MGNRYIPLKYMHDLETIVAVLILIFSEIMFVITLYVMCVVW